MTSDQERNQRDRPLGVTRSASRKTTQGMSLPIAGDFKVGHVLGFHGRFYCTLLTGMDKSCAKALLMLPRYLKSSVVFGDCVCEVYLLPFA